MPSVFKAWLDQIMVAGRTISHTSAPPAAGRPAVLISARRGGYDPGAPKHGLDHVVPMLEAILVTPATLGLDLTAVTPELTMAPYVPMLEPLLPLHEASMADSHNRVRILATTIAAQHAA